MNFIKRKIVVIKSDKILSGSIAVCIFLLFWHVWQFIYSGYAIEPLIRVVFYACLIPCIFLFGRNALFYGFLIFAYILTLTIQFNNYTPFIIITLFCMIKIPGIGKKEMIKKLIILFIYLMLVFVVCSIHGKCVSHLVIHLVNCFCIFFITSYFVKNKTYPKPLILDETQKQILQEIASGKQQKEITFVSKNTITAKLKDAMETNKLLTKEHLLMRYIAENIENK